MALELIVLPCFLNTIYCARGTRMFMAGGYYGYLMSEDLLAECGTRQRYYSQNNVVPNFYTT